MSRSTILLGTILTVGSTLLVPVFIPCDAQEDQSPASGGMNDRGFDEPDVTIDGTWDAPFIGGWSESRFDECDVECDATVDGTWDAPFIGGWSECPLDASLDEIEGTTYVDAESGWWRDWWCCWRRDCKRSKPVKSCYPEVIPIGGPHHGYHRTTWRQLPEHQFVPDPFLPAGNLQPPVLHGQTDPMMLPMPAAPSAPPAPTAPLDE